MRIVSLFCLEIHLLRDSPAEIIKCKMFGLGSEESDVAAVLSGGAAVSSHNVRATHSRQSKQETQAGGH